MHGINPGIVPDYIGMANPDASLLLVGSEKALNPDIHQQIIHHELLHNVNHWRDILFNYNHLGDSFDPVLLTRPNPLDGFNPYNPLFFLRANEHRIGGGHTYTRMRGLINHHENLNGLPQTALDTHVFRQHTFSKFFMTELSMNIAPNQNIAGFNLGDFLDSDRYRFMSGLASPFYQDFKTTILYAGNRYVGAPGTPERLAIIRIFNPNLSHHDLNVLNPDNDAINIHYYQSKLGGSRVIISRHFTAFGPWNEYANALAGLII